MREGLDTLSKSKLDPPYLSCWKGGNRIGFQLDPCICTHPAHKLQVNFSNKQLEENYCKLVVTYIFDIAFDTASMKIRAITPNSE